MMKFKRTFFGGYKRREVDFQSQKWEESEELFNSRINFLESENKLLKESSQKEINEYKLKISEKDKLLDEAQNKIEILENKVKSLKAEIEKSEEENAVLSKTIRENQNTVNLYEAEIIRLGRLYLDALDYSEKIKTQAKEKSAEVVNNIFSEILKTESEYSEFINYINNNRLVIENMAEKIEASLTDIRKYLRESENGLSDIGQIYLRLENEKNSLIRSISRDDTFGTPKFNSYKTPIENKYSAPDSEIYFAPGSDAVNSDETEKETLENKGEYSKYFNEIEKKYTEETQAKPAPKPSIKDILEKYSNMS